MVWESIVFMSWASLGTFQIIASFARLEGLSFFNHRIAGYIFGTANIVGSFCWFFATVEFGEGGPKGQHDDQFVSFVLGIASAILLTWILASLIKFKAFSQQQNGSAKGCGIEVFEKRTFFQLTRHSAGRHKTEI